VPQQALCRRTVLCGAAVCLLAPKSAHAGYALQAAHVASHSTTATGKDAEKAVYEEIKSSIDAKRPDRPEVGELGYVGGEYTKEASRRRDEFDDLLAQQQEQKASLTSYAKPQDFLK